VQVALLACVHIGRTRDTLCRFAQTDTHKKRPVSVNIALVDKIYVYAVSNRHLMPFEVEWNCFGFVLGDVGGFLNN